MSYLAKNPRSCSLRRPQVGAQILLVVATLLAVPAGAVGDEPVAAGFVFETTGDWISERAGRPLGVVDPVFPRDEIRPPLRPTAHSAIAIAFYDGTAVRLACRSSTACDGTYVVRAASASADSTLARIRKALGLIAPSELDLLAVPGVRGSGPREAVLARTSISFALAPALAEVRPGRYTVELRPWTGSGAAAQGTAIEVAWRPPESVVLSGAPPGPGLFQMTLTDRAGDVVGGALVLLASESDFGPASQAFERIRNLADKWEDAIGEGAARRFEIESLLALARDPAVARGRP